MRKLTLLLVVCVLCAPALAIKPGWRKAKLMDAQPIGAISDGRALAYRIRLLVDGILIDADHHATFYWNSYAPAEFVLNGPVNVRFEGDRILLLRPNGKELKARIVRKIKVEPERAAQPPRVPASGLD